MSTLLDDDVSNLEDGARRELRDVEFEEHVRGLDAVERLAIDAPDGRTRAIDRLDREPGVADPERGRSRVGNGCRAPRERTVGQPDVSYLDPIVPDVVERDVEDGHVQCRRTRLHVRPWR